MHLTLSESELPVRLHFERSFSDEELLRFCSDNQPFQIEREANGELTIMTPTFSKTGRIELRVCTALDLWATQDGTGDCFGPSAGFTLPDSSVRAADAHWISHSRWNALPPDGQEGFAQVCPDFVVEIRSASDSLKDLRAKMQMWLSNGAQLAWLLDPERKAVEVYRPNQPVELYDNPTSIQASAPIQGFELVLDRIWH